MTHHPNSRIPVTTDLTDPFLPMLNCIQSNYPRYRRICPHQLNRLPTCKVKLFGSRTTRRLPPAHQRSLNRQSDEVVDLTGDPRDDLSAQEDLEDRPVERRRLVPPPRSRTAYRILKSQWPNNDANGDLDPTQQDALVQANCVEYNINPTWEGDLDRYVAAIRA